MISMPARLTTLQTIATVNAGRTIELQFVQPNLLQGHTNAGSRRYSHLALGADQSIAEKFSRAVNQRGPEFLRNRRSAFRADAGGVGGEIVAAGGAVACNWPGAN